MSLARRVSNEGVAMSATRVARPASRRSATRKTAGHKAGKPIPVGKPVKHAARPLPPAPEQVLFRFCKAGWAVIVEKSATALGTRFVCPFCPQSHRVPGPVRGFRKMRRAQWIKLRRVAE